MLGRKDRSTSMVCSFVSLLLLHRLWILPPVFFFAVIDSLDIPKAYMKSSCSVTVIMVSGLDAAIRY